MMKLGLLGIDPQIAWVLEAAHRSGDQLVVACDVAAASPHAQSLGDSLPRDSSWETLIDARSCDAILVGGDGWSDTRVEAVRKLVQAGRTLVLSQPLELSMLWAYELDMIRKDSGARLIPILPDRLHPFIARLRLIIEGVLGSRNGLTQSDRDSTIETILLERRMPQRSRTAVLRQLASDADLVRVLSGDPRKLSTLGGSAPETSWPTLAVGFDGPSHVPARWQIMHGDSQSAGLTLSLIGPTAAHRIQIPDGPRGDWLWSDATASVNAESVFFDRGDAILDVLRTCIEGNSHERMVGTLVRKTDIPPAGWDDASRAIELAETVPRSVARGRAIDLHQEEFTELGTFKGTMASLGCGIVLIALLLLVVATLVGGIARAVGWGVGERIAGVWPLAVLAVLGVFLSLQLLPLLVAKRPQTPPSPLPVPPRQRE